MVLETRLQHIRSLAYVGQAKRSPGKNCTKSNGNQCRAGTPQAKSIASKFKAQNAKDSQLVHPQPGLQPSGNGSGSCRAEDTAPFQSVLATRPPWHRLRQLEKIKPGWLAGWLVGWLAGKH